MIFSFPQKSIHCKNNIKVCVQFIWCFELFKLPRSLICASSVFITNFICYNNSKCFKQYKYYSRDVKVLLSRKYNMSKLEAVGAVKKLPTRFWWLSYARSHIQLLYCVSKICILVDHLKRYSSSAVYFSFSMDLHSVPCSSFVHSMYVCFGSRTDPESVLKESV